jgi:hypothetical protein
MMDDPHEEEDSDNNTAIEDRDNYTATSCELLNANLLQYVTKTKNLFNNANPLERISKETTVALYV